MKIFRKNARNQGANYEDALNQVLYKVPGTDQSITWGDATEGTLVLGATGSGKSSAVGRTIAHAQLKSGAGMCVLCAKKEEKDRWLSYIQQVAPERMED
ncbi:MAG: hypothetical protein HRT61_23635, partial [Ekhidna sp.]|nr:hypothetical protein [Ekhidna sp.]